MRLHFSSIVCVYMLCFCTLCVISVFPVLPQELKLVLLRAAIPMIGFGFMDNFVLIIAGDYIDGTIGVTLGISTMCAAALGNIARSIHENHH